MSNIAGFPLKHPENDTEFYSQENETLAMQQNINVLSFLLRRARKKDKRVRRCGLSHSQHAR